MGANLHMALRKRERGAKILHAVIRLQPFLASLALPVLAGLLTSHLSGSADGYYQTLALPSFAPPGALFGVVWTILYLFMGLASYLIYTSRLSRSDRYSALTWFGLSLLVNYMWSFLFFRFHLLLFSACWIVIIFAVTALCTAVFYRIRPAAGVLMTPTLAWLVFAAVLNFSIAGLN